MLFHRLEAWNLANAMYQDGRLGFQINPFIEGRLKDGLRNGWISPERSREALEMFVVDEMPLRPSDLDIDIPAVGQHLPLWHEVIKNADQRMRQYGFDHLRAMKGVILANLARRGAGIPEEQFELIINTWDRVPKDFRWKLPGALAGRGHKGWNSDKAYEVELEFKSAAVSLELASQGIPTYCQPPKPPPSTLISEPDALERDALRIARFYFENQVRVPSPASFSDALRLRENTRVRNWRGQVLDWSSKLAAGKLSYNDIAREIEDANGYIDGANIPLRLIPRWVSLAVLPAAFCHTFITSSEWTHVVGYALFAYESFRFIFEGISRSVQGSNPLQYNWLLVSNHD